MSTISLWFDGGDLYGWGNIRRTLELGARLARRGHRIHWHPLSERAAGLARIEPSTLPPTADVAILDLPYAGDTTLAAARALSRRTLALDYAGDTAPDLTVSLQAVRALPTRARHVVGIEYAIIREELRRAAPDPASAGGVLVILGGGDRSGLGEAVLDRLVGKVSGLTVIDGPLSATETTAHPQVHRLRQPTDLPQRMAGCSWAVTTGGTTMLELLCLGKAVHVVPRTPEETRFAERLHSVGALLGVGLASLQTPTLSAIARCESLGPSLVDGAGCERIASLVEGLSR